MKKAAAVLQSPPAPPRCSQVDRGLVLVVSSAAVVTWTRYIVWASSRVLFSAQLSLLDIKESVSCSRWDIIHLYSSLNLPKTQQGYFCFIPLKCVSVYNIWCLTHRYDGLSCFAGSSPLTVSWKILHKEGWFVHLSASQDMCNLRISRTMSKALCRKHIVYGDLSTDEEQILNGCFISL